MLLCIFAHKNTLQKYKLFLYLQNNCRYIFVCTSQPEWALIFSNRNANGLRYLVLCCSALQAVVCATLLPQSVALRL